MDELERDLRATLGNLADGATPSDGLVDTTIERSAQIRRRRRAFAASTVALVALVVAIAIASIAGAGTRGTPVRVSDPGFGSTPSESTSTTTTTEASTTTTAVPPPTLARRPGSGSKGPKPGVAVGSVTTTTAPACGSQATTDQLARSGEQYTTLPNGDIEVSFGGHPFGPGRETYQYVLDDGTTHDGGFLQTYSPDQFGTHWFDLYDVLGGTVNCVGRVTFTVGTDRGPTTSTTTTTIPTDTTTTVAATTTSSPS
ncbi:MAG: hypothetical protein QOE62_1272 [Actinomycetota bacterium]|nr:hypothetical protein [Actinomycetota bacterium]